MVPDCTLKKEADAHGLPPPMPRWLQETLVLFVAFWIVHMIFLGSTLKLEN